MRRLRSAVQLDRLVDELHRVFDQVQMLVQEMKNIKVRCERSERNGDVNFLQLQQMRRTTLDGMVRVYAHFAYRKAERILSISRRAEYMRVAAFLQASLAQYHLEYAMRAGQVDIEEIIAASFIEEALEYDTSEDEDE